MSTGSVSRRYPCLCYVSMLMTPFYASLGHVRPHKTCQIASWTIGGLRWLTATGKDESDKRQAASQWRTRRRMVWTRRLLCVCVCVRGTDAEWRQTSWWDNEITSRQTGWRIVCVCVCHICNMRPLMWANVIRCVTTQAISLVAQLRQKSAPCVTTKASHQKWSDEFAGRVMIDELKRCGCASVHTLLALGCSRIRNSRITFTLGETQWTFKDYVSFFLVGFS